MTVTTNEFGQQNPFAKEPQMYVSKTDVERYGYETYGNGEIKWTTFAMLGFIAATVSYTTTGSLFFFGAFDSTFEIIFTTTSIAFFVLLAYSVETTI